MGGLNRNFSISGYDSPFVGNLTIFYNRRIIVKGNTWTYMIGKGVVDVPNFYIFPFLTTNLQNTMLFTLADNLVIIEI